MRTRGLKSDDRVAASNAPAIEDRAALNGANGKTCYIILSWTLEARQLSCLATDQSAAGYPTPLSDARNDIFGLPRFELSSLSLIHI